MRHVRVVFVILTALFVGNSASATALYSVDFSPPHTVGYPPLVGTGPIPRDMPTSLSTFGFHTVVGTFAGLSDQAFEITAQGVGRPSATFLLSDLPTYAYYAAQMDISIEHMETNAGQFAVDFSGVVVTFDWVNPGGGAQVQAGGTGIGTWEAGVPIHLRIVSVPGAGQWVFLDFVQVYFSPLGLLPSSLHLSTLPGARVVVDNVIINGTNDPVSVEDQSWGSTKAKYRD